MIRSTRDQACLRAVCGRDPDDRSDAVTIGIRSLHREGEGVVHIALLAAHVAHQDRGNVVVAHEEVNPTVPVHVAPRQTGPRLRELRRQQRFAAEVVVRTMLGLLDEDIDDEWQQMRDPRIGEDTSDLGGVTDADPAGEQGVADGRVSIE